MVAQKPAALVVATEALPDPSPRLSEQLLDLVDRRRHLLLLGVLGLYLLGFNAQWRVERDSALYLSMGRNLAQGSGYTYLGRPQQLAFPGLPLLFTGIFRLFHTNQTTIPLVVMLLLGFATLGLTYRLFLLHCGRPTAVLMVCGLAMTRLFYRYCFELLSDMPFLLGVMAFLVGYEAIFFARRRGIPCRRAIYARNGLPQAPRQNTLLWFDWTLLLSGLAIAISTRVAMVVLLAAIVLALCWAAVRGEVSLRQILLSLAVLVAAAYAFHLLDPRLNGSGKATGQYEDYIFDSKFGQLGATLREMFRSNIPELLESAATKALFGCPILPGLNTLLGLVLIGLSVWLLWHRVLWGLWAILTVVMLLVFKPLDRYFLPVIPLLVYAWWQFLVYLNHRLPARWADSVFLALLIFGASTNLARLGEMVVEQRRVPFLAHYRDGRYASLNSIRRAVGTATHPHDWLLVEPNAGRILTYVTDRYAVEPSDTIHLDPATEPVFAFVGPSWDEHGGDLPGPDPVLSWIEHHGFALGPAIGHPIASWHDHDPWTLHRVIPRQPR